MDTQTILQAIKPYVAGWVTKEGTWTPSFGGFSADPTGVFNYVKIVSRLCFISFTMSGGTSNQTYFTMNLPFTAAPYNQVFAVTVVDSGADQPMGVAVIYAATPYRVDFYKSASAAFTASGGKRASGSFIYALL